MSDRILLVKIHGQPFDLSIIQVYAPTSDLEDAYGKCGNQDIVIVMGDMNVNVASEQDPLKEIVGGHGFGERNERGDLWVEWCTTHEYLVPTSPATLIHMEESG